MENLEFETLTAEEFDEYLKNHKEKDYLLIDVRQEPEYELGHIPGAKLMPVYCKMPIVRDLAHFATRVISMKEVQSRGS